MLLRATVHHMTGSTKHSVTAEGDPKPLPPAVQVEIADAEGGFLLIRYAADDAFAGDTWHATIDEAKRQAQAEYGVVPTAWEAAS